MNSVLYLIRGRLVSEFMRMLFYSVFVFTKISPVVLWSDEHDFHMALRPISKTLINRPNALTEILKPKQVE